MDALVELCCQHGELRTLSAPWLLAEPGAAWFLYFY